MHFYFLVRLHSISSITITCLAFYDRKLKNRVAAQTARDRKKQRMTELEEMIIVLESKNKQLQAENDELRRSAQTLVDENKDLRHRLETTSSSEQQTEDVDVVATRTLSESVTEPAVLDTPLPQETDRTSLQLAATYLMACMIIWSVMFIILLF